MTSQIMKNLLATGYSTCTSAEKQIFSEEDRSRKVDVTALIYLTVKLHGAIESTFKVFAKRGLSSVPHSWLNDDINTCKCSGCMKFGAHCRACCKSKGYWMNECTCSNCEKNDGR